MVSTVAPSAIPVVSPAVHTPPKVPAVLEPNTRFAAALVPAPMPLPRPPSARCQTIAVVLPVAVPVAEMIAVPV